MSVIEIRENPPFWDWDMSRREKDLMNEAYQGLVWQTLRERFPKAAVVHFLETTRDIEEIEITGADPTTILEILQWCKVKALFSDVGAKNWAMTILETE